MVAAYVLLFMPLIHTFYSVSYGNDSPFWIMKDHFVFDDLIIWKSYICWCFFSGVAFIGVNIGTDGGPS